MLNTRTRTLTRSAAIALAVAFAVAPALAHGGSGGVVLSGDSSSKSKGVFPVKAKHTYGDGLGAGRGHQGQDLLARCGKPVVAAKPGKVRVVGFQASGAGRYVVVKGKRFDYVYFHMLRNLHVGKGDRLEAGDRIGRVGSTGDSSACHLHFEIWTRPGWYRGGGVKNPTPSLRKWDRRGNA